MPSQRIQPSVSFKSTVKVRPTLHISEYSAQEVAACWYDDEDKEAIRSDIRSTLALMEGGVQVFGSEYICTRGLESLTKTRRAEKKQLREKATAAVFEEQYLQDVEMVYDPDYIAMVYAEITNASVKAARKTGTADAKFAAERQDESKHAAPSTRKELQIKTSVRISTKAAFQLHRVTSSAA